MPTSRSYQGHPDLELMMGLEQEIAAGQYPTLPRWQPGDIVWTLYLHGPGEDVRLWFRGDKLVAFAFFAPELYVEALPKDAEATRQAFNWAEGLARDSGRESIATFSLDSDDGRNRLLAGRNWRRSGAGGVRMRLRLKAAVAAPRLPPGVVMRDCREVDLHERADAHRDAWSDLAEIGLPEARSSFSADRYRRLRETPGYDPSLDLAVQTADGTIAACCIAWADDVNGVGHFEPVGTRSAFRRQGLAKAMILYGLARMKARGLRTALIGTARFNHPARATYLSCGFEVVDGDNEYVLDLRSGPASD